MTVFKIIFHEELNAFSVFVDIVVLLTNVKKKLYEKLSLSDALKQTPVSLKMKLTEKNTIL